MSALERTSQRSVVPMQMRQCEGAENELIHWATVLILQSYNSFLLVPASPLLCCQAAECFAESWAAWQGYVGGRSQIDQSFQPRPKAATIIKLGLDHVVVIHKAHNREIEASTQAGKQTLLTHPSSSSLTHSLSLHLFILLSLSPAFFFSSIYLSHHLFAL